MRVDAYHCLPGAGLAFPDDWSPMATASLPASGSIPSGGSTIVGPFAFVPTQVGHECLLAIARADGDAERDPVDVRPPLGREQLVLQLDREPGGSSRQAALYRLRYTALKAATERGFLVRVVELIPDSLLIADALGRPLVKNQTHDALSARLACAPRLIPFLAALLKAPEDVAARMVSEVLGGQTQNLYANLDPEDRTLNVALERLELGELGTSLLLMTRDVSALTRLERLKGTAYAGMTEHVRGALQAVSMTAEMVGLDSDEQEVQESMELIRSKVGEIDDALGDAAQATSLDLETAETHNVAIDLGEELARVLEVATPQANELGVTLQREGQEITHHAVGRATPMRQAMELILQEAIASSPAQGEVRASLLLRETEVWVEVRDRGDDARSLLQGEHDADLENLMQQAGGTATREEDSGWRVVRLALPRYPRLATTLE